MVVVFFRLSSVILSASLQLGRWNFKVFVLRTYFFLPEEGAAVVFGVAAGFAVALGLGVAVGEGCVKTNGLAFDSLIRARRVSAAVESAVTAIRPASVKG